MGSQGVGHREILQPGVVVQAAILGPRPGSCEEVSQEGNLPHNRSDETGQGQQWQSSTPFLGSTSSHSWSPSPSPSASQSCITPTSNETTATPIPTHMELSNNARITASIFQQHLLAITDDINVSFISPRPTMPPTIISTRDESTAGTNSDSDEDIPAWESYDGSAAKIKLHIRDIFHESLCTSHNPAAGWASSACNIPAKWELFMAMVWCHCQEMRETNYPSSYSYQPILSKLPSSPSLQVIEKHHLEDDDEQNESHKRCRVIMSKGEDITEKFWTDKKELQEILDKKRSFLQQCVNTSNQ